MLMLAREIGFPEAEILFPTGTGDLEDDEIQDLVELAADGVLNPKAPFEHKAQWEFWELWHHEGRRARHGASMMGPDYTQWHGNYEVAHRFYMEFVPQLKAVLHKAEQSGDQKKIEAARSVQAELDKVLNSDYHRWFVGRMTAPEREARKKAAIRAS